MKKVLLVLGLAIGFIACEKETVIVIEDNDNCEECQGATIQLAPQARGPVNRGDIYAWIDVITVVAVDDNAVDYGAEFNLVDDSSGANGFYLEGVPVNEIIDFSASSTSVTQSYNGLNMQQTTTPEVLTTFVARMPYAEYATDTPVSQQISVGENIVNLQMNTLHGRLISSFRLADDIQYLQSNSNPRYRLRITSGSVTEWATTSDGVVSYYNGETSVAGETITYTVVIEDFDNGAAVVYSTTITEDVIASTSISTKYVVGLDFVDSTGVEVIFSWQVWEETEGDGTGNGTTSPNGLDCDSCGSVGNQGFAGNQSLTEDLVISDKNVTFNGGLNLNGYTLTVSCGTLLINGNLNGGGTIIVAGDVNVTGQIQNNPVIHANECF